MGAELQSKAKSLAGQGGVPWPEFAKSTTAALPSEGVTFTVPAGQISYLAVQSAHDKSRSGSVFLPQQWTEAQVLESGTVRRVGTDANGGEILHFTPDPKFKGQFLVSLTADRQQGTSLKFDTEAVKSEASKPETFKSQTEKALVLPAPLNRESSVQKEEKATVRSDEKSEKSSNITPVPEPDKMEWKAVTGATPFSFQMDFSVPASFKETVKVVATGTTTQSGEVNHFIDAKSKDSAKWNEVKPEGNIVRDTWTQIDGAVAVRSQTLKDGTERIAVTAMNGFVGTVNIVVGGKEQKWTFGPQQPTSSSVDSVSLASSNSNQVTSGFDPRYGCDAEAFVNMLNYIRQQSNLPPVRLDYNLSMKAAMNNQEQVQRRDAGHFWHDGSCAQCSAWAPGRNELGVIYEWLASWQTKNNVQGGHKGVLLDPGIQIIGIHRMGDYWTFTAFPSRTAYQR